MHKWVHTWKDEEIDSDSLHTPEIIGNENLRWAPPGPSSPFWAPVASVRPSRWGVTAARLTRRARPGGETSRGRVIDSAMALSNVNNAADHSIRRAYATNNGNRHWPAPHRIAVLQRKQRFCGVFTNDLCFLTALALFSDKRNGRPIEKERSVHTNALQNKRCQSQQVF